MRRISNFQWLLILAICALIVLLVGATSLYLRLNLPDLLPEDINDSAMSWSFWTFWALHTPLSFMLTRRFSSEGMSLTRRLLVQFLVGIIWALLLQGLPHLVLTIWQYFTNNIVLGFRLPVIHWASNFLLPNIFLYWMIFSANFIFLYYERYQKEMLKATKLDAQLSNARLQSLKMQLHPHFLFNTLHSISALVLKNENRDAVKMINRLSELLRLALDNIETQVVSLEDEIEFTRRYLEIERIRFHDRLVIEWEIDPLAFKAQVPNLILQPLVENAMRHGVDSSSQTSRIQIVVQLQQDQVLMEVRDDGKDSEKVSAQHGASGLGLKNTRARLLELYGKECRFNLSRREDGWTAAQIVIPFLPAHEPSEKES